MDKHAEAQAARDAAARQEPAEHSHQALPRYSSASTISLGPELSEHVFQLADSKGRPWVWLTVKSRAKDKKTWPLYYERDIIHGTVEVDFDKTDGAKAVAVSVSPRLGGPASQSRTPSSIVRPDMYIFARAIIAARSPLASQRSAKKSSGS